MKKKIAFFQNDLDVGGIQKSAVNLMRNMDYDRFEMHLFLSRKDDFWNLDFPKELHIHYLNPTPRFYSFVPFDYALKHIHYDFPVSVFRSPCFCSLPCTGPVRPALCRLSPSIVRRRQAPSSCR